MLRKKAEKAHVYRCLAKKDAGERMYHVQTACKLDAVRCKNFIINLKRAGLIPLKAVK